jgi:SSS family solute:Na+ symporter/sodium/pantothenate symporter
VRYFHLIAENPLVWGLFLAYMALTAWLAWLGHKKTDDIKSFAIGRGDLHPVIVGITLAASICSTATFVINPGFVYIHGIAALMHLGVAVSVGLGVGLTIMSFRFRRIGEATSAITIPQWMGNRYGSTAMAVFFAVVQFLSLFFVVLIIGGISIVMQKTLGLSNTEALTLTVGFVFSYIFVGGTYAHVYTNTLQGAIMIAVTLVILASGLHLFGDGVSAFADKVSAADPNLLKLINPRSDLYGSFFSVYVCGFVIGFAVVCQPHIMTKALYVKDDRAVRQYLIVTIAVTLLFMALLIVGLYARAAGLPPDLRQDAVMTVYVTETFPPWVVAFITVALLAASMSTLDGILVAMSSIAANDLFLNLTRNNLLRTMSAHQQAHTAHRASQAILVAIGLLAFAISYDPPRLLGIFGQVGVYGLIAASTIPILFGVLFRSFGKIAATTSAVVGMVVHFALYRWGWRAESSGVDLQAWARESGLMGLLFDDSAVQLGMRNPGVTATYGLVASALVALLALALARAGRARTA